MSDATQQSQTRRKAVSEISQAVSRDEAGKRRGWIWIGLISIGLLGVLIVGGMSQQEKLSISRTATVIAEAQATIQALAVQAEAVEGGERGAIAKMQGARAKLARTLGVLKTGGRAAAGDSVSVIALDNYPNISLPAVEGALTQFDQASLPLVENASLLERAAAAEAAFSPALAAAASGINDLVRRPSFLQGAWKNGVQSLRQEWTRPELVTMPVVFAPMEGAAELQQQWSQRFKAQSSEIAKLSAVAAKDARVSASDRAALADFAKQVAIIASSSATLAEATPVRLRVKDAKSQWRAPLVSGQEALDKAASVVFEMARGAGWGTYVSWALGLVGIFGLIMLALDWSRNQKTASLVSRESVAVQHGQEQIDQVTRQLRRIVPGDAPMQKGMRIHEEPDSMSFPIASMVNRILDTFDHAEEAIKTQAVEIDLSLASGLEAGKNLSTQSQRHRQSIVQTENAVHDLAKQAAGLARRSSALVSGLEQCSDSLKQSVHVVQQGMFQGDALRENTQDSAKRIKRLSESAQTISLAVDLIYGVIQQVQVLSMNVAIEAANAGEQGRKFVVISQEIQRLVANGTSAAQQIDKVIETILTDAKETVAAMEQGTSEVVESGKLSVRAMASMRDAEKEMATLLSELPKLGKDIERQALASAETVSQIQLVGSNMSDTVADAGKAQDVFGKARSLASKIVRMIEQGDTRSLWRKS